MRAAVVVLGLPTVLVCVGCGFRGQAVPDSNGPPTDGSPDTSGEDARPDGLPDGPPSDGCVSFSQQVNTCALTFGGDLTISGMATYNTDTQQLLVGGVAVPVTTMRLSMSGVVVDAILAGNVRLTERAVLHGIQNEVQTVRRPMAILASGTVTLEDNASIDVSDGGAGALNVCSNTPDNGTSNAGGAGGGGGAGFGAAGGDGGGGNGSGTGSEAAGGDGAASFGPVRGPLGGCPGARGGTNTGMGVPGSGGRGGGAVYIAARDQITLGTGAVLQANGGGGLGGKVAPGGGNNGGGGGGSGGMIFLEAPSVMGALAGLFANGGGGGEGASNIEPGADGSRGLTIVAPAPGGTGGALEGADGGQGGSRNSPAGQSVTVVLPAAGGGGGGGVGYIHVVSSNTQLSGSVSPAATPPRPPLP